MEYLLGIVLEIDEVAWKLPRPDGEVFHVVHWKIYKVVKYNKEWGKPIKTMLLVCVRNFHKLNN